MADSDVLYVAGPSPWTREGLIAELRRRLQGQVEHAFLFGSHARGLADADSDIDLIIVSETTESPVRRPMRFGDSLLGLGAVDLLVYTPAEWRQISTSRDGFFEHIHPDLVSVL